MHLGTSLTSRFSLAVKAGSFRSTTVAFGKDKHIKDMPDSTVLPSDEIARKMAHRLMEAESNLRAALMQVDASAVFSCYALSRLPSMHEESVAKHSRPAPAAIELAAWILYPEFGHSKSKSDEQIQIAITALEEYQSAFTFVEMFPLLPEGEQEDELAMRLRIHSGMVRGSAYPIQIVRRIEGVMRSLEPQFSSLVGIGPCRACEVVRALITQVEDNANGMRDALRDALAQSGKLAAKGERLTEADRIQLAALDGKMRSILETMKGEWSPTQTQLASRLGGLLDPEWAALVSAVGLTPSSRATLKKAVDVQDRPVFVLDAKRAFTLHGSAGFDAIFTFFDSYARSDSVLRDRYGKCIADWMEAEIERQLARLFPSASIFRNACFLDPDNPGGETEADLVVVWWPFLILVEAKGKRVATEALRGSRIKLRQTLSQNIQDAFIQSRRVLRLLERDGRIRFKERTTERIVEVQLNQLRRIMPISVTLQNLSGIPTQLALTQRLGLFKGNAYPWSVAIDDLDVITRFAGSPDIFLHYIERRTAHQSIPVGLNGDELDIFGHYLDNRLHPSLYEDRKEIVEHTKGATNIAFIGGEEDFEPFYMADWNGESPPPTTVGLKVPASIQAVLQELRNRTDDGARWVAFALLGLSQAALDRMASALEAMKVNKAQGQRVLRTTMHEGDIVINVLAHSGLSADEFFKVATIRSRLEHYRSRPRATLTVGVDQRDSSKAFEVAQWLERPWEFEPELEKLLVEDSDQSRIVQIPRGADKIGRNNKCPCGSGKKFKKCCLGRMTFIRARE